MGHPRRKAVRWWQVWFRYGTDPSQYARALDRRRRGRATAERALDAKKGCVP
jgi:hypothetical protein